MVLTIKQRVFIVECYAKHNSWKRCAELFAQEFQTGRVLAKPPAKAAMQNLVAKWRETDYVANKNRGLTIRKEFEHQKHCSSAGKPRTKSGEIATPFISANDQLVLADSEDNLQTAVHLLRIVANNYNLKISHRKTKVFGFCGNNTIRTKIVIEDEMIEEVNSFTYLGCDLSYISSTDVENKLNKFLRLIGTIKRTLINKVDRKTVLKFYKTLAIPTLLYGSETWILTRAQQRRIEAAEMRLLRPLAGFRLQDHKRNEDIRTWFRERHCDDTPLAGQRQIQMGRNLTPVSERVGVVEGRKQEKCIAIIASHNVLVSHIFATAALHEHFREGNGDRNWKRIIFSDEVTFSTTKNGPTLVYHPPVTLFDHDTLPFVSVVVVCLYRVGDEFLVVEWAQSIVFAGN
ncbi:hypothetical protein ANN_23503 [Periplaneta americana]|uniref:DUF4817 domain-containing protein n=1 Tax=Periplaneta americana TaxID=6978 RepID=A0ABQ8SMH8_PERAM|nr:hypothetical protein ANN_23503 [Periplaneta americana]